MVPYNRENIGYTEFNCTVAGLFDKTYGKMPEKQSEAQIIMEYEFYMQLLAQSTIFNKTIVNDD